MSLCGREAAAGSSRPYTLGLCHAQINEIEEQDYAAGNECHIYVLKKHMFRSPNTVITLHSEVK